jgi:hypothetical protein
MATTKPRKLQKGRAGIFDRMFLEHPRSLDMSWSAHGAGAVKVGLQLIGAGVAALIHAAIPGLFGETASNIVIRVHDHIHKLNAKRCGDG